MTGPWEAYKQAPTGPWSIYGPTGTAALAPNEAQDISDAIIAGLQESATGLLARGKKADMHLPADAPWYWRAASGAAGMALDLPVSIVGAVGGAAAGSAALPGVGTAVGAGAGAFAAPMALREGLIAAYSRDGAMSWQGAWDIAKASLAGGAKGAVIGGATAGAGRLVAPLIAPAAGGAVMAGNVSARAGRGLVDAGVAGTELLALTGTAAAMDGRMPTAQDFLDNAILLGGMKAATHVAQGLRNVYAETGKLPAEVAAAAREDPALLAALTKEGGKPGEIPDAFKSLAVEERINAAISHDPRPELLRQFMAMENPPKLGEHPIKDVVRYEYITDSATLQGVIRRVTDLYSREMANQRRGEIPNQLTVQEGIRMVADGKVAEHVIGSAENAAQIAARAHILRGLTAEAFRAAKDMEALRPEDVTLPMKLRVLAAMEKVAMAKAELEGVGAEAGRSLQIFAALKRDPNAFGEAQRMVDVYERAGKGDITQIAKMVSSLTDPAQMAKFAEGLTKATTSEKIIEVWKAAILSGPQTHLANILGNVGKMFVEVPESAFAATLEAVRRAAKGEPMNMAQYKARALAPWYGLTMGAREGFMVAGEVIKGKGEHLEKADVYRTAIKGKKGEVIRIPFKALQAEDVVFRSMAERAEAYKMAIDRATNEALHPDSKEFRAKVVDYTNEPVLGLDGAQAAKAVEQIQNAGAEAVFAQRLGVRMEQAQRAMSGSVVAQMVIPFVRTPTNLVSWAIQHVPGLNLMSARWRSDFMAGGERQSRAIARVVVGTGIAMTAYQFAKDGSLTGGGMFDPEQRRTKLAAGWQPYSIKLGDKYYSYQRMEPVAKVLGIAADLFEMFGRLDTNEKAKALPLIVMLFGNMTISTTYLSGLAKTFNALTDPVRHGEVWYEGYVSSIVPRIVGQTAAAMDPYHREVKGVVDAIQAQVPIFRERLLPQRDVWGEPRKNEKLFSVMPVQTSEESKNKVRTEAARLQLSMSDAPRFLVERGPFKPSEKSIELTPEQRDIYKQVSGKQAMAILEPIVNAPDWERIPDFAKGAVIKKVVELTRKNAQYATLPADAAARAAIREKIVSEIIKQTQEAERK